MFSQMARKKIKIGVKRLIDCKSSFGKYMIQKEGLCVPEEKKKRSTDTHSQLLDDFKEFIT